VIQRARQTILRKRTAFQLLAGGALLIAVASPAEAQVREFSIPAGSLKSALDSFARQSGKQILYRLDDVRSVRSKGISGRRSFGAALHELLEGTGLRARADSSGALAIIRAVPAAKQPFAIAAAPAPTQVEAASASAQSIIVTGSRLAQPNLDSAGPVSVVSSHEIQLSGVSRTEDAINALPQAFAAQGANISNGASGTATVNLRGLGEARSLVLVNGRRLQPGDVLSPYADINMVPPALIKRVEVLTGGASSVYGADAVAGVVNFVLDTSFTGIRLDGQASVFNHYNDTNADILKANAIRGLYPPHGWSTNGGAQDVTGVFGAAFDDDRGHVTAFAAYRSQDPILQSTRDYSFCALGALPQPPSFPDIPRFFCGGPSESANGSFIQLNPQTFETIDLFQVSGHSFVPGFTSFNPAPYNYYQRPDERYSFGAFADYRLSGEISAYGELLFMDDHSLAQIAPSGDFRDTNRIACDNALLSQQQRDRICAPGRTFTGPLNGGENVEQTLTYVMRRNVEGGGRVDDIRHTDYRIVGGLRGDATPGVSFDAYYQFGRTLRNETYLNDFSVTRLARASDAVAVDANGQIVAPGTPGSTIVCRSVVTGIDTNCVPYNIFQEGSVTPEALAYLETPGFQRGVIDETVAHGDLTIEGDDYGLRIPWAETGVRLNVGAEYRKEKLDFDVDEQFRSGDLAGIGGPIPPVHGTFDVRELFAEIQLPIVQHDVIDELTLSGGYRFSNYRVAGDGFHTDTYKLEAELAPVRDIRIRGSYNRAVRAPNITELFFPQSQGIAASADPCASPFGTSMPAWTAEQCRLTGVSASQYGHIVGNPAGQYNVLLGGNPSLRPEKADTWVAGVILRPSFIPGLAVTADYWKIRIKNLIGPSDFRATLEACAGVDRPQDPAACALIHRSPGTGSLWLGSGFIDVTNRNFAGIDLTTNGFDVQGSYERRMPSLGTLGISFSGTRVFNRDLPGPGNECAGYFGGICGTPTPEWRHKLRVSLFGSRAGISGAWRHFSGVDSKMPVNPGTSRLSAAEYFDLALQFRASRWVNLRIGANNVLDREPPIGGGAVGVGFGNGNTFPQVYDALGRYLFAAFTIDY